MASPNVISLTDARARRIAVSSDGDGDGDGDGQMLPHPQRMDRYFVNEDRKAGIPLDLADAKWQAAIDAENLLRRIETGAPKEFVRVILRDNANRFSEWLESRVRYDRRNSTHIVAVAA